MNSRASRRLVVLAVMAVAAQSRADVRSWTAFSGNWGTGTNWNTPFTPPGIKDVASILFTDKIPRTITLDVNGAFSSLELGNIGKLTLSQVGGSNLLGATEYVGFSASASHNQQLGTNTLTQSLVLANDAGGAGTYTLGGGTLHVQSSLFNTPGELIGSLGTGTLNQTGGTNTDESPLYVGRSSGSQGAYNQSGGTATIGTPTKLMPMNIANDAGSIGAYTISGSANMLVNGSGYVGGSAGGSGGTGALTMNGGTLTANALTVYSTGTLNFNAGTLTVPTITDSGLITGRGTTAAAVIVNSGGGISPGGSAIAAISLGSLTTNSGSNLFFDPGDQLTITNSNGLNLAGATTLAVTGSPNGTYPLINYSGALGGSIANLIGPTSGSEETYKIQNNAALHQVQLVAKKLGTQQTLGIEEQASPGGGIFTGFGEDADPEHAADLTVPVLNNAGQVTFQAQYLAAPNGNGHGIFRWSNGSLSLIATLGQAAPGGGTFTSVTTNPSLNSAGTVVFGGSLTGASDGATAGLFTSNGIALSAAARNFQLANGGGQYTFEGSPSIDSNGQVVFYAGLFNDADHASTGIFSSEGFMLARNNHTAPGGGTFTDFDQALPVLGTGGQTAFMARLTDLPGSTQGIFTATVTNQTRIVRNGQPTVEGGSFGTLSDVSGLSINSAGQVTFASQILNAPDGAPVGIFRGNGTAIPVTIVRANSSFPNHALVTDFSGVTANEAGQVAFEAVDSSFTGLGIYRADSSSSLTTIASKGALAPDGQFFVGFNAASINAGGTVAFTGYLAATAGGSSTGSAIYLSNGISTLPVIETGQALAGSTVAGLESAFSENDFGQVAYTAYLANGLAGNFLFTPALHWVGGSGGWDTAANWTAGLTPISIHDVYLDPATSQTITGPAGNVTVNSLTIGGNAPVTFNMTGGQVTVLNSFNVAADGSAINVSRGTISLPAFTNLGIATFVGNTIFGGNVTNNGTFTAGGIQTWPSNETFTNSSGTATFTSDPNSSLTVVAAGGTITFASTQHLLALSISTGAKVVFGQPVARVKPVLVTSALTFDGVTNAWAGQLDLTRYDMVVHNGVLGDIANQLKSGFNAGAGYWNGSAGIISSIAAADTSRLTTLGYRTSDGSTFDGEPTSTTDVLVKYTYYGDADLNGSVNGSDYQQIDNGFGSQLTGWFNGDFNYDGTVNGSDFALIDNTFNQITATGAAGLAIVATPSDLSASSTAVPEPIGLGILGFGTIAMLGRQRRSPSTCLA